MNNLRVPQAAEYLGVSKSLLNKMRSYGGGPTFAKLGSTVVYLRDDLDAWVASNRQAVTPKAPTMFIVGRGIAE